MTAFVRKRGLLSLVFTAVPILLFLSSASAAVNGTQNISVTSHNVKGRGSFYPSREWNLQYDGSLRFRENAGDREYSGAFDYTYTDDGNAPRRFAVQRMTFGLKKETMEFHLGDFFADFSEYSLANPLKGIHAAFGDPEHRRLRIAVGIDAPSWASLTGERGADENAGRRYVWGARLENPLSGGRGSISLNYAGARDDAAFMAPDAASLQTNVFSVDGRYRFTEHLEGNAEIATGYADPDTRSPEGTGAGAAGRVGFDLTLPRYSLHTTYRRMSDRFRPVGGYTGRERERLDVGGKWTLPRVTLAHHFRASTMSPEAGSVKETAGGVSAAFALPGDLSWEIGVDLLKRRSPDRTVDSLTSTYSNSLSRGFRHFRGRLAASRSSVEENTRPEFSRDTDSLSLGVSGGFPLRGVDVSWNMEEELKLTRYRGSGKSDSSTRTNAGIKARFPSSLTVEAHASLGTNRFAAGEADGDVTQLYLGVLRQIWDGVSFSVSCERKKHDYKASVNNVTENTVKASLRCVF